MTTQPITPMMREKLLIALQITDTVEHINTALRARKAVLTLDYSDGITPKLIISMPGSKPEPWLMANPRTKYCTSRRIEDPSLQALVRDIEIRMGQIDAYIAIGTVRKPNEKAIAKAQVFFRDAKRTAITLFAVSRGEKKSQDHFLLPKGFAT